MAYYWAKFQKDNDNIFRFDTRIYLNDILDVNESDFCIGAIVGKNPGSAKANDIKSNSLQTINLDGDKLLPTVRNIFLKAYKESSKDIPSNAYVQVLNLFYLCDENLNNAIKKINDYESSFLDEVEVKKFNLVWYVWGGKNNNLSNFKTRFHKLNSNNHIFYDNENKCISHSIPNNEAFAKHTQGLSHNNIVSHLSKLL